MPDVIYQKQLENTKIYGTRNDFVNHLPKKMSFLEAGVLGGDFAEYVINKTKPKLVHLVDPFYSIDEFANEFDGPRWNDRTENYNFVKNRFKNHPEVILHNTPFENYISYNKTIFDFIYFDYGHDYDTTTNQLQKGITILSEGGIIGFNDYNIYVNETKNGDKLGTVPAINNFLRNNSNWYVYAFALNDNLTSDIYLKKLH